MSAWGSLKNIFENPLPDSLSSWSQLLPEAPGTSFEMFGELCHRVNSSSSSPNSPTPPPPPPPPPIPFNSNQTPQFRNPSWGETMSEPDENAFEIFGELCYTTKPEPTPNSSGSPPFDPKLKFCDEPKINDGLSPENSGSSLKLCTEGLGFESLGEAEDSSGDAAKKEKKDGAMYMRSYSDVRSRNSRGLFPPPISSIGRCGKPRVYFKSYRKDGRFVLREIRIPTQQLLHATREDGRLKMRVAHPDEDIGGGEEEGGGGGEEEEGEMAKGNSE